MFFCFFDAPNEMNTIKVTMQKDFSLFLKLKLLTFQDYFPINQSNRNFNTILNNAEKLTSRFWVLNRKSNGSFQVSFLFKTLSKNREVIFCVRLSTIEHKL